MNPFDYIQLGATLLGFVVTIATLKADVRWMRKWCDDHQQRDDTSFEQAREDIRELRGQMMRLDAERRAAGKGV